MGAASDAVRAYGDQGLVAFSVDIQWDPDAKQGRGGKRSRHPANWPGSGGAARDSWNSVAINTGLSGLVVIDVDSDDSLRQLRQAAALRAVDLTTREARSGSRRGGHLYFRADPGDEPLKSIDNIEIWHVRDGVTGKSNVDVKAAGGLIYAPPSGYAMPDGTARRYEWVDESVPIAPLPPGLRGVLPRQGAAKGGAAKDAAKAGAEASESTAESVASPAGPPRARQGRPHAESALSSTECMKLLAALADSRAAGTRTGDWFRVGCALKHNEGLLLREGRAAEAKHMAGFFDAFSLRAPEQYPGSEQIQREYDGFKDGSAMANPVTVGSLVLMAREDSAAAGKPDPVKSLVASRAGCDPSEVAVRRNDDGLLYISTPRGAGHVDPRDLTMFLPSLSAMLAAPAEDAEGGIELPKNFSARAKKHGANFKRGQILEYHRDTQDVARVRPKGAQFPIVKVMDPHSEAAVVRFTETEGGRPTQLTQVEEWNAALVDALAVACKAALGPDTYGAIVNYGTVNQNIVINNAPAEGEDGSKKMLDLEDRLLADAKDRKLMKRNGMVYEPLPGKPCAYRADVEYEAHISRVFGADRKLRSSPDNIAALGRFLAKFQDLEDFPQYAPDLDLVSFSNGVFDIARREFIPYADLAPDSAAAKRTARHHIEGDWTGEEHTPALDSILDYQDFDAETRRFVLALMGRMLFRVKQLDRWEVILFFFGAAGTGKSLCLNLIGWLYDQQTIGAFASKQDGNFPLQGFLGKDVIVNTETERDMLASVNESDLKKMASGEDAVVNRKNKEPLRIPRWQAPMAFGSNYLPKFSKENTDSLGRRIVPVRHSNVVRRRDGTLEGRLRAELPDICCRIVNAYHGLVAEFGDVDITQHLPDQMREWGGDVRAANSRLYEFLASEEEDREAVVGGALQTIKITREEGAIMSRAEFAELFEAWADEKFVNDEAAFSAFGFYSPASKVNVCKSCGKHHKKACCAEYATHHRAQKRAIAHIVVECAARRT